MRTILIINNETNEKFQMPFPSEKVKDSEVLNYLLSYVDPGDEYTVLFTNKDMDVDATKDIVVRLF